MSGKIRILHFIPTLGLGGAEMVLYKLVTALEQRNFSSQVVTLTDKGPIAEKLEKAGIKVSNLGIQRGIPSLRAVSRLYNILQREKPDILQTWMYTANLYGLMAGKLAQIPTIVWSLHVAKINFPVNPFTHVAVHLGSWLSKYADAIVVISQAGLEYHALRGYDSKKMIVILNGIDCNEFQPRHEAKQLLCEELKINLDPILIGLVARFNSQKDHKNFLTAYAVLAKDFPNSRVILIGPGIDQSNKELNGLIHELEIKEQVFLLGERNDINHIMPGLDMLVSSSLSEGFSLAIGEAMACGVPCVVTDTGDSSRIVQNTGFVVPSSDPIGLEEAIRKMLNLDKNERSRLGVMARQRVMENYSLEKTMQLYQNIYQRLINKK